MNRFERRAYSNARIRAMKGELFSRERLDDLLDQDDVSVLVEVLLESPYRRDMNVALTANKDELAVEEAVSKHLADTFRKLLLMADDAQSNHAHLFLLRWDLSAVKTLLRNLHHGMDVASVEAFPHPSPHLNHATLERLHEAKSMEELVGRLVAWEPGLCRPLAEALPAYRDTGQAALLEDALDRSYFVENVRRLPKRMPKPGPETSAAFDGHLLRIVLQMEIDRMNLRSLLQLRGKDALRDLEQRLLPEGALSPRLLRKMAAAPDPEHAIELLGTTAYSGIIEGLFQFLQTHRFSPIQRLLDMILLLQLKRLSRQHTLSIAVLMHYAWLKYNEVMNLRMIARGLVRHLPRGRVREGVLYV